MLRLHSEKLREEWLDIYGHMNEAYYLVVASNATWALQDYLDLGSAYSEVARCGLYTVESHLRYLADIHSPAQIDVESGLFAFDRKRIHIGHILKVDGKECATVECTLLHVNMDTGRTEPFAEQAFATLAATPTVALPTWSGSRVSLVR